VRPERRRKRGDLPWYVLKSWGDGQGYVFNREDGAPLSETWTDQQYADIRKLPKLPQEFVLHCLRHTFGTD
jgi:hypothetical protein